MSPLFSAFQYAVKWFWLPLRIALGVVTPRRQILGSYFSGVIARAGKDVTEFSAGDQVFGAAEPDGQVGHRHE